MSVQHKLQYRTTVAEGAEIVLYPTPEVVKTVIFWSALAKLIELYVDDRMVQGHASALYKGGWSFSMDESVSLRGVAIAEATAALIEGELKLVEDPHFHAGDRLMLAAEREFLQDTVSRVAERGSGGNAAGA